MTHDGSRRFPPLILYAVVTLAAVTAPVVNAAAPPCADPVSALATLGVTPATPESLGDSLVAVNWSDGQSLKIEAVHRLTGRCRAEVVGFDGRQVELRGNRVATWDEAGRFGAPTPSALTPAVARIPDIEHEDHSHSIDLGDFVGGSRIAAKAAAAGANQYFVGVWRPKLQRVDGRQRAPVSTLAVYARTRDGIFSSAAPLLRSTLPVRAVTYVPGEDPESGILGIVQDDGETLNLVSARWRHRDYSR
jgi:hypothetical protein